MVAIFSEPRRPAATRQSSLAISVANIFCRRADLTETSGQLADNLSSVVLPGKPKNFSSILPRKRHSLLREECHRAALFPTPAKPFAPFPRYFLPFLPRTFFAARSSMTACAAASRAIGTRNGEALT